MKTTETYWIVRCVGTERNSSRSDPNVLTEPKPFVGYISGIDWGYSADADRAYAHRFTKPPTFVGVPRIGPGSLTIDRVEFFQVTRTIVESEEFIGAVSK